jgi:hypothetical protein
VCQSVKKIKKVPWEGKGEEACGGPVIPGPRYFLGMTFTVVFDGGVVAGLLSVKGGVVAGLLSVKGLVVFLGMLMFGGFFTATPGGALAFCPGTAAAGSFRPAVGGNVPGAATEGEGGVGVGRRAPATSRGFAGAAGPGATATGFGL